MEESSVEHRDHNDSPPTDLAEAKLIASLHDRHERNIGSHRRESLPIRAVNSLSLAIDGKRTAQRQQQKRTEKHHGGKVAVVKQVRHRP